jgi:hypothetical protein
MVLATLFMCVWGVGEAWEGIESGGKNRTVEGSHQADQENT